MRIGRVRLEPLSDLDRISALEALISDIRLELDRRFANQDTLTSLKVETVSKTVEVAQTTANKAVLKAEAAAERAHMEAHIDGLRRQFETQTESAKLTLQASITAQKEALHAALISSEKAILTAAAATDKAIIKSEQAYDKRFDLLNEFRAQSDDRERNFATKPEIDYKFESVNKAVSDHQQWGRGIELKFSEYVTTTQLDRYQSATTEWRRTVDAALTSASSKSSLIYAVIAMAIAAGGLLVAVFNLFMRSPHAGG